MLELYKNYFPAERLTENMLELITDYAELITTQPASADHHLNHKGGWLQHTFNVFNVAQRLSFMVRPDESEMHKIHMESLLFCVLVHDIGKLGYTYNPGYIENDETGEWEYNKNLDHMSHEQRTLFILHKYGIRLSPDEYVAILYHAGLYSHTVNQINRAETPLLLLLHTADNLSAKILEA